MKLKIRLILFFLCFISSGISAQNKKFTISGTIYEKGSEESLPGVVVLETNSQTGTVSNAFGFYSITLPAGDVNLDYQFVGFASQKRKMTLSSNLIMDIRLESEAILGEVEVSAERQQRISEDTRMSTIEIPIDQIKNIPALLGEKDVLKVIQLMPGVQKGSEGQTGFYVRGGGPDQNLILLDDATVYNANHLFGFFSIFNGDALKSVELTKGGFPARYGGRLSSVLEMRMKDGNKEKLHGEAGIGLLSSRLTLEGPVKKGKSSFLVSGRRTYIDVLTQPLIMAANNGAMAGYFFYDFNAKYNHTIDSLNRIYVSGYFGKDKFYFRDRSSGNSSNGNFLWGNATGTARWNHILNEKMFSNTSLIFTNYSFGIGFSEASKNATYELRYRSGIRDYSIKHDLDFIPNPNHYIRTGAIFTYHRFSPSAIVIESTGSDGQEFESVDEREVIPSYESAVYIEDDWSVTDIFKVNLGVRLSQYYAQSKNYLRPEPRVAARVMLSKDMSAKASYAIMNQYVHLLSNTGAGLPTDLWVPATERIGPQQSQQWAVGLARDISNLGLMVSLEGYYKMMNGVISYKDGASFLDSGADAGENQDDPLRWQDNVTTGSGESYGAELLIQKKFGKLSGWIGYTLSWTTLKFDELNFGKEFFARYDRRHDISVVGIYKVNDRMTLSATWVYGTGQAITLPLASYATEQQAPQFNNGNVNIFPNYAFVQDYGARNDFRMRSFHRLDIGAQWHKKLKRCERTFELGVYNAYNRRNPFYYFIDSTYNNDGTVTNTLKQRSLFPILPSFTWTFKW
jgi:hypothetical protein